LENSTISSLALVAATVITLLDEAGDDLQESSFSFPAAETTLMP